MEVIKNTLLGIVTGTALYLVICGVKLTFFPVPGWKQEWLPVQIAMIIVGGAWLILFVLANNAEDEIWGDDDEE